MMMMTQALDRLLLNGSWSLTYLHCCSEMEDKYNAICLLLSSLRTESLTITQRLEHSTAERDLVENILSQEMQVLHFLFLVSLFLFLYRRISTLVFVVVRGATRAAVGAAAAVVFPNCAIAARF